MVSDFVSSSAEQHCIIRILVKEKVKLEIILCRLNTQYGEETMSQTSVCDRYSKFSEDCKEVKIQLPVSKIMASVFWDSGVMHVDSL
jgi:hypothetical protein